MVNTEISSEDQPIPAGTRQNPRKPYCKPQLIVLGDLRTLTLGGSPGINDSGGGVYIENPFGP